MAKNDLGLLRRSAAASGFGPGAIIDFRAGDAAISAVAAGLEEWDRNFPPAGVLHSQVIHEERLQKKLGVKGFRLPPIRDPQSERDQDRALFAVRFPQWLQCPQCDLIGPEDLWSDRPGDPARWCAECTQKAPGRNRVTVVPVRFVMACKAGHLDDFPWHTWVGHLESCKRRQGFLKLTSESAGLAGIILSCPTCHARRSLDGIFSSSTWERFPNCRGRRPWLAGPNETCQLKARAVQRGASNLYFPVGESALSIPPWSDRLQEALGVHFDPIVNTLPEDRAAYIRILARGDLAPVLQELQMTPDDLTREIERRLGAHNVIDTGNLRLEEYRQFTGGVPVQGPDREFEIRPQQVPDAIRPWFCRLVKVVRLREVRALTGFTRIDPPGNLTGPNIAALSAGAVRDWLPALEVRGEGIFLEFDPKALTHWEAISSVAERAARIDARRQAEWLERYGPDAPLPEPVTSRLVMIHTFAHALMRQLTLDCGYSSSALRERLYVSVGDPAMAGVLIYTATTDDDGTLGGLQRQGDPARIGRTVLSALHAQAWCSSDPLCIEDMMTAEDALSLAACHACALAPETACEEFNRFLDRALLVGAPGRPELGYFHSALQSLAP
jgi:hypothetical protein